MRTLYPSSFKRRPLRTPGSGSPQKRPSSSWFSREYLSHIWAKRPAKLVALLAFVSIVGLLIYVFAASPEANTLTLCGSGGGTLVGTTCNAGNVTLSTVGTAYTWHKGGYDGGGRGNAAAIDPLDAGVAALGGDVWGAHVTTNSGDEWTPTNWGAQGIGQVYMRASAFSLKSPGTVYWGVGGLHAGASAGYFGTTPAGTVKLQQTNSSFGFGTSLPQCTSCAYSAPASFTPRAVGKLILVDCDSPCSSNTEYIYALSNQGISRSTNAGANFTVLGGASAIYGAWKSIAKAPDGSLYAIDWGDRTTDNSVTNQHLYHVSNPRGAATVATETGPPGPMNDLANINGTMWCVTAKGLYKLTASGWQVVGTNTISGVTGLTLASVDGVGSTIYVGSGNIPSGSEKWVAKSVDGGATWNWMTSNAHVSTTVQGTSRTFWLAGRTMPGDQFGIEQLVVDHNNPNFVLMSTFRGAYSTTDGGNTWKPSVNGLDGTEVSNIKVGPGAAEAWNNDTDWGGSGKPWCTIHTTDHYDDVAGSNTCQSFGGGALTRTVGGVTYTVSWNSTMKSYDITAGGKSIADDYFRGAVTNPSDLQIDSNGYIYIAIFGGGVLIGTPPGH